MAKHNWIKESEAAERLGYTSCEHFRRLVKSGKIPIAWTNVYGRNHFYSETDIEKLMLKKSTLIRESFFS
jgi:uncharacterized phage protein gp47/JayE